MYYAPVKPSARIGVMHTLFSLGPKWVKVYHTERLGVSTGLMGNATDLDWHSQTLIYKGRETY